VRSASAAEVAQLVTNGFKCITLYDDRVAHMVLPCVNACTLLAGMTVDNSSEDSSDGDKDILSSQQNLISNLQNAFSAVSSSSSKSSDDSDTATNGAASTAKAAADVTVELELSELSATAG
jgi:hypothetical protein